MDEIRARRLIADQLGLPPASVVGAAQLDALGADPLDVLALVGLLERTFGVRIGDAQAEACRTVRDLLDAVRTAPPRRCDTPASAAVHA